MDERQLVARRGGERHRVRRLGGLQGRERVRQVPFEQAMSQGIDEDRDEDDGESADGRRPPFGLGELCAAARAILSHLFDASLARCRRRGAAMS